MSSSPGFGSGFGSEYGTFNVLSGLYLAQFVWVVDD